MPGDIKAVLILCKKPHQPAAKADYSIHIIRIE